MQVGDRFLQAVPANEPHHIERPAVVELSEAVDGHDRRVLQTPGDFGFHQKPLSAFRLRGEPRLDFLQRDLTVQLCVQGDRNLAESSPGMGPQDTETRAGLPSTSAHTRGWFARLDMRGRCAVQRRIHLVVLNRVKFSLQGGNRTHGRQALFRIAPVHFKVLRHHGDQKLVGVLSQRSARQQEVLEPCLLIQQPRLHRRDQLVAVDEVHLQRENADQQIAIELRGCHCGTLRDG